MVLERKNSMNIQKNLEYFYYDNIASASLWIKTITEAIAGLLKEKNNLI